MRWKQSISSPFLKVDLPFFNKANKTLGVRDFKKSEVTPFHSACVTSIEKIGIPRTNNLNDLYEDNGVDISPVNNLHGQRFNAAFGYLDPVRENGYLSIVGDALVDKINLRGNKACSVDAIINKKRINIILKKIHSKSKKLNIDPKITNRIWKNMILSYIDFEKRNFKKK